MKTTIEFIFRVLLDLYKVFAPLHLSFFLSFLPSFSLSLFLLWQEMSVQLSTVARRVFFVVVIYQFFFIKRENKDVN